MPLIGPIPGCQPKPLYRHARTGVSQLTHANGAAPTSISLSNTVPGYTTLGGKFRFNAPGSTETDYAIFGYQVPSTHRLCIDRVAISTAVGVALTTTASLLEWALALNGGSASLADVSAGPVIPLGLQGFLASAAAGQGAPDIVREFFPAALIVDAGAYVHTVCRNTLGGSTGTFRGAVTFSGWFEPIDGITNGG